MTTSSAVRVPIESAREDGADPATLGPEAILSWQHAVLDGIAKALPLTETLETLCREAASRSPPGRHYMVLLAEVGGRRLLRGAAPSFPTEYHRAMDGMAVGEGVASSGTAAYRRAQVVVTDIAADPLWKDHRALALPLGLRACWSTPILSSKGDLLGTWDVYDAQPGGPSPLDVEMQHVATRLAAIAIEKARSDESARLAEERGRTALAKAQEIAHLGSWTWDLATGRVEWSDELCRMHGVDRGTITDFDDLLARAHPDDRAALARVLEGALRSDEPAELEYRLIRTDGHVRWARGRAEAFRDQEGAPARLVGTCLDVTDARRAQDGLIRLAAIVQDSSDAMYTKSVDGRITEWNPGAERLYGWARDEILGKPIHTLVPEDRIEEEQGILARVTLGERVPPFETERVRKDGTRFPVSLSVSPLRNEAGRIVGASAVARDISERLRVERELTARAHALARMTEALARSNRELDQFAYITSHDLKAPLRGISNLSRWIEEDADGSLGEESRKHLELLRGRVNRMEALIDAILEYSRVGRVRTNLASVDVGKLLVEVADLLAPPEGFRIESKGALPTVVAERMRLQQVLMNLLSNAVKHHHQKDKGRVIVSAEDAGSFWRFRVQDDGPGIPARFHDKIFILFQTLEPRDKVEGTGIGLALVKKIVEGYGGTIAVESEPGRGAAFVFTWPKLIEGENTP